MNIEITKEELISLIKRHWPDFQQMDIIEVMGFGRYIGGFTDEWEWNEDALNKLHEEKLLQILEELRNKRNDKSKLLTDEDIRNKALKKALDFYKL